MEVCWEGILAPHQSSLAAPPPRLWCAFGTKTQFLQLTCGGFPAQNIPVEIIFKFSIEKREIIHSFLGQFNPRHTTSSRGGCFTARGVLGGCVTPLSPCSLSPWVAPGPSEQGTALSIPGMDAAPRGPSKLNYDGLLPQPSFRTFHLGGMSEHPISDPKSLSEQPGYF